MISTVDPGREILLASAAPWSDMKKKTVSVWCEQATTDIKFFIQQMHSEEACSEGQVERDALCMLIFSDWLVTGRW